MVPPRVPNPPARFAVSLIDPPTRAVGVAAVVRTGVAWVMTLVSPGSLHAVAIAALLVDPMWIPLNCSHPAWPYADGCVVEVTVPAPVVTTALELVKIVALPHVASFGPYSALSLHDALPIYPPARFAVSLIGPPTRAVGVATVVRAGVARLTTLVSPGSLHAVAIAALL